MRALLVAEGGYRAGLGHIVRCRVLAGELVRAGHDAALVLHGDRNALAQRAWPGAEAVTEIGEDAPISVVTQAVSERLANGGYDWLVVDGYRFSGNEVKAMRGSSACRVLVLDDVPGRALVGDLLLNQNSTSSTGYASVSGQIGSFLLGPQFALVDPCYLKSRRVAIQGESVRRVLVSFGGVDRHGRTARVIELLSLAANSPLAIDVVIGPYFPHRTRLTSAVRNLSICVHDNLPDLSGLMKDCDLMISAAGSTAWQACCVGIPLMVFQTVDNQKSVVDALMDARAALCANATAATAPGSGIDAGEFDTMFEAMQSQTVRLGLAERAARLVDGEGAGRVVGAMLTYGIQVTQ